MICPKFRMWNLFKPIVSLSIRGHTVCFDQFSLGTKHFRRLQFHQIFWNEMLKNLWQRLEASNVSYQFNRNASTITEDNSFKMNTNWCQIVNIEEMLIPSGAFPVPKVLRISLFRSHFLLKFPNISSLDLKGWTATLFRNTFHLHNKRQRHYLYVTYSYIFLLTKCYYNVSCITETQIHPKTRKYVFAISKTLTTITQTIPESHRKQSGHLIEVVMVPNDV